jgi:glucans biosynthesis protein
MHRRDLLVRSAFLSIAAALAGRTPARADDAAPSGTAPGASFDASTVRNLARNLAQQSYKAPDASLPGGLDKIDYQAYRSIRFDSGHALWRGQGVKFTAEFFLRGFLYKERVDIFEVAGGHATPIRYSPDLFTFDKVQAPTGDIGFAGFRIHNPINRPDYFDEICAFLGASYFRAVARNQGYGLSARGLAIKTAEQSGEEFPLFRSFWLERPAKGSDVIVVHALLDSPSAAAAFRFTIRPGQQTVFDTEMALYPRSDLTVAGIAPLTSMFLFDANDRTRVDDRPADLERQGRADLASAGQSARIADQRLCRQRAARLRAAAAGTPAQRLPGPRGALREASVALGRAGRRLGPGRRRAGRDTDEPRVQRQHRRILATA